MVPCNHPAEITQCTALDGKPSFWEAWPFDWGCCVGKCSWNLGPCWKSNHARDHETIEWGDNSMVGTETIMVWGSGVVFWRAHLHKMQFRAGQPDSEWWQCQQAQTPTAWPLYLHHVHLGFPNLRLSRGLQLFVLDDSVIKHKQHSQVPGVLCD